MVYIQIRPIRDLYHEMIIRWTPWNPFFASSKVITLFRQLAFFSVWITVHSLSLEQFTFPDRSSC